MLSQCICYTSETYQILSPLPFLYFPLLIHKNFLFTCYNYRYGVNQEDSKYPGHPKHSVASTKEAGQGLYRIAGYTGGNNIWRIARKRKKIAIGGYKFRGYGTIATPSLGIGAILADLILAV